MKLPRNLDDLVESGRSNLEGLVDGGRKGAQRLYDDGRHWIEDRLPDPRDLRRRAEHETAATQARARAAVRRAADDDRLRAPVRWIEARLPEPRRASSVLWPSVAAAAGAGVAFWWWTSWSRGRAEAAERAALDAAGGAAGQAHPEAVMAHAPEPTGAPVDAPDPSAAELAGPAEDVMAHAPPPSEVAPEKSGAAVKARPASPRAGKATADEARLLASTAAAGLEGGVGAVAPTPAVESLDESLAVQGSAKPSPARAGVNGRGKPGAAVA